MKQNPSINISTFTLESNTQQRHLFLAVKNLHVFPDVFSDLVLLKIQLPQYVDPNFLFRSILSLPLWM